MNDDGAHLRQAPPNLPTLGIKKMNETEWKDDGAHHNQEPPSPPTLGIKKRNEDDERKDDGAYHNQAPPNQRTRGIEKVNEKMKFLHKIQHMHRVYVGVAIPLYLCYQNFQSACKTKLSTLWR